MKKTDRQAFHDFMFDEATRYGRNLSLPEVETYFENFPRVKLEEFKQAWVTHKRDPKNGQFFPKITDLQRVLRTTGEDLAATDWRCTVEIGEERCGFAGAISAVGLPRNICSAHYRLFQSGTVGNADERSRQIIEASRDYVPPKNDMELAERGQKLREESGARWRETHAKAVQAVKERQARAASDPDRLMAKAAPLPPKPAGAAQADDLDEVNAALAAAGEAE